MDHAEKQQWRIDSAYRAIGRYFVEFSLLMQRMREMLGEHVAGGISGSHKPELLMGEAMPTAIANAFFGMCRLETEFDENELKVASVLSRAVKTEIEMRNDIAHGDWEVGWLSPAAPYAVRDPHLIRIQPGRVEGPRKVQRLSVQDIDKLASRVIALLALVDEFGHLALGLPILLANPRENGLSVSTGEYRVRDVFVARQQTRGGPTKIRRDGPRSAELLRRDFDMSYQFYWGADSTSENDSAAS